MNPYTRNLELAILSGDGERINRETERLMQAIANDLSAVTRKYGTDSAFHGLILAVVDNFAASLRLIADPPTERSKEFTVEVREDGPYLFERPMLRGYIITAYWPLPDKEEQP